MQWGTLVGWIGGVLSTVIVLLVKASIEKRKEDRTAKRAFENRDQDKRSDQDRLTYNHRITVLIRIHLATYIRSGKWWSDEEDLRRLVASLENDTNEHFIDETVDSLWETLVGVTIELARKRLDGRIEEQDVQRYNKIRRDWENAAKLSFGPLPETPDLGQPRYTRGKDSRSHRAA